MSEKHKETILGRWNDKELILHECVRYRGLLRQIAERLLDGCGNADEAVDRCIVAAANTRMPMHSRGEFRSWVLRLVIDEALHLLHETAAAVGDCGAEQEILEPAGLARGKAN
jgi:DNA-directed RNA polymerase specialized sigma24 family protein